MSRSLIHFQVQHNGDCVTLIQYCNLVNAFRNTLFIIFPRTAIWVENIELFIHYVWLSNVFNVMLWFMRRRLKLNGFNIYIECWLNEVSCENAKGRIGAVSDCKYDFSGFATQHPISVSVSHYPPSFWDYTCWVKVSTSSS